MPVHLLITGGSQGSHAINMAAVAALPLVKASGLDFTVTYQTGDADLEQDAAIKLGLLPEDSLARLEGRSFLVEVVDAGGQACFTYRNGLFRPLFRLPDSPDLSFRANLSAFLQLLARQEDPDTLFFNRDLSITGDTELGLLVKNMLDAVEWPPLPRLPRLPRSPSLRY